jgi:hypothetical protein
MYTPWLGGLRGRSCRGGSRTAPTRCTHRVRKAWSPLGSNLAKRRPKVSWKAIAFGSLRNSLILTSKLVGTMGGLFKSHWQCRNYVRLPWDEQVTACKRAGDGLCGIIVGFWGLAHCEIKEQALSRPHPLPIPMGVQSTARYF